MKTNEAILKRIEEICEEKGKNICKACLNGGKSPSALYDLMKGRTKCPKVTTIKSFCEGAGITLSEFFDRDYFNDLEDDDSHKKSPDSERNPGFDFVFGYTVCVLSGM